MYYIYILQSRVTGKYYVGQTGDIDARLSAHNAGKNRSTKPGRPWDLKYLEEAPSRSYAWKRERQIKAFKGGAAFKRLLK